ncbi:hypothetical protein R1sor_010777 [Riccia sorocarpa]|uniref:DUF7869 domain-containing protein n=1 Tax=Riccia sorocarpa TaxID=122646 RepID=A0ABD3I321_9MARC
MGKVLLKFQGRVVALGELESRNPDDVCLGVVLGPGRMKVAIISMFDEICPLPYPTQDTDKLHESIRSYVLWDTAEMMLVENGEPSRAETGGAGTPIVPYTGTGPDPDARSPRQQIPEFEVWKKRSHWCQKEVIVLSKEKNPVQIAKGKILYSEPKTNIAGTLLGEEYAGVVVFTAKVDVDGSLLSSQLPNFVSGQVHLCRWPINYLRVRENGRVLGDLYVRLPACYDKKDTLLKAFMRHDIFEKTVLAPKHQTAAQFFNMDDEVANSQDRPFRKLSSIFYIQLDNSGKDNKNWAVMSFLSELVMRGVFKTIVMSFLIVGHTHEDVDAYFSKINMSLSHRQITSLPEILSMIYSAEARKALPRLITEVADYKLHAEPYRKTVVGISKPVAFKFYMEDNMPMFQFQDKYGGSWSQGNSLWRRKDRKSKTDFSLVLHPDQEPLSAPMNRTHDNKEEIVSYLTAYIAHIGEIQAKTSTSNESYALDQAIIDYWKNIKSVFEGEAWETYEGRPLKHGFWPRTNHGTGYQRPGVGNEQDRQRLERDLLMREAEEELLERNQLFVGHPSEKEREHFAPLLDIQIGVMLLIRPSDKFPVQNSIWVAKAMTCVIREVDSNRFNQLQVEWYRPKHRLSNASKEQRYALCMRSTQEWEKDPAPYEEDFTFVDASTCIYCWTSKSKTDKLRLTAKGLEVANLMLQRVAEEEP